MNDLTASDWINIIIALGVGATAVFAALTARSAKRQSRLYLPVVEAGIRKAEKDTLCTISFLLIPSDRERFKIVKATIVSPRRARLYNAVAKLDSTGGFYQEPTGSAVRSVTFSGTEPWGYALAFLDPCGADEVAISLQVALKADSKIASRTTVRHKIHD